jgi:hypothetical protein
MITTKDFASEEKVSKVSPILGPGVTKARITNVQLQENYTFKTDGSVYLVLNLEGEPITDPNFQGWLIDSNNPSGPRFLGQTGRVKFKAFPMKDSTITRNMPDGSSKVINISRDNDYIQSIIALANAFGPAIREQIDMIQATDIFDHVQQVSRIFSNKTMTFVIAAKGYKNAKGYTAYDLFLPYDKTGKKAFALAGQEDNLITFDKAVHVTEPKEDKPVAGFEPNNDFSL